MDKHTYCVIMAGGIGSRFWPKSRQSKPKQFLDILGTGKSFIRMTYERFEKLAPAENFLVVTNARYKDLVLEQIPELGPEQVLCEPVGRNTAPCICYAAYGLQKRSGSEDDRHPGGSPDPQRGGFPRHHRRMPRLIDDRAALMDRPAIKPTRPETGYGYIQVSDDRTISKVKCLHRKTQPGAGADVPAMRRISLELRHLRLESRRHHRSGAHLPARAPRPLLGHASRYLGTSEEAEAIARVFSECRSISIDYDVMEKANNVYVRRGEFG